MADNFISVNRSKQHGNKLVRLAELIQEAQNIADDLDANAQVMWDTGVYTTLEDKFGVGSGAGANLLTLIGNTKTALAHANLAEIVSRIANQ